MRNFTSSSKISSTYVLDASTSMMDPAFVRVQLAMMCAMGANPNFMSPSEESCLADFTGWVMRNLSCYAAVGFNGDDVVVTRRADETQVLSPVFTYVNLNEGHSVVVVWSDEKGKVSYFA